VRKCQAIIKIHYFDVTVYDFGRAHFFERAKIARWSRLKLCNFAIVKVHQKLFNFIQHENSYESVQ